MPKQKNPLNDDDYTGNDEQIDDLKDALRAVVEAGREVINNWSQGDLAAAVNNLEEAITPYEEED